MSANGFGTHETLVTVTWLDNTESDLDEVQQMAANASSSYDLAKQLKEYVFNMIVFNIMRETNGLEAELLKSALDDVNWNEIADYYYNDYHEDD